MSMENFEKAMLLAQETKDYMSSGGVEIELIEKAEEVFGFKLSPQHYKYYKEYGTVEWEGNEFYGLFPEAFEKYIYISAILETLDTRESQNLPKKWIPIYNYDEDMAYLDYENLNEKGEPRVIAAYYDGEKYVFVEELAEDLGDYFLMMVNDYFKEYN